MKSHVYILSAFIVLFMGACAKAQPAVQKLWETHKILDIPESVFYDGDVLYVTLINGGPWEKDGKGGVAKVSTAGKITNVAWITDLNAPKGMCKDENILYVADIDEVVLINIKKGIIEKKIKIDGAEALNDITIDEKGIVYVTDSQNGKVFKLENNNSTMYFEGLKGINGIRATSNGLYMLTGDGVYKADAVKILTKLGDLEHGGDGIEPVGNGDFIVTSWPGYMYYFHADGKKELLLDTHTTNHKTADIGYDPKNKIIYVPTFLAKSVVAYKLMP